MASNSDFRAYVVELFAPFAPVTVRPMFGAAGIFADGIMFGVISDERIFLKTDEQSRAAYAAEDSKPFTFAKSSGELIVTSYCELPARLYDEPDELVAWARRAYDVALGSPTGQRKQRARMRQPKRRQK